MYDDWPLLEFPDLNHTVLDLFSRETGEEVASRLLSEIVNDSNGNGNKNEVVVHTDDQLRWIMQVLNHSLSLPLSTERQYGSIRIAVQSYLHWLRSLTSTIDSSIPRPLLETPEQYFRNILDALRSIFVRRKWMDTISIERQAGLISSVLETTRFITKNSREKYQDEVWSRSLSFSLNSSDLLLSPPIIPGDVSCHVGSAVIDSLFSLWMNAVAEERIPSPSYWRTLAVLSSKWRHHVTVIESWANKLLALSVLVTRNVYGPDYCTIPVEDESLSAFSSTSSIPVHTSVSCEMDIDERTKVLYELWQNMFSLIPSPKEILRHVPEGGSTEKADQDQQKLCFFLAVTTIQRMVDIFYGDNRVSINMNECEKYFKYNNKEAPPPEPPPRRGPHSSAETRTFSSLSAGANTSNALSGQSGSSSSTGPSRTNSDMKSHRTSRMSGEISDRSIKTTPTVDLTDSGTGVTPSSSSGTSSTAYRRATSLSSNGIDGGGINNIAIAASNIVAFSLHNSPGVHSCSSSRSPRSSRLLDLTMNWLLNASSSSMKDNEGGTHDDTHDDVISSLSLCSADTTIGEEEKTMLSSERTDKRSSYAGSVSSTSSINGGQSTSGRDTHSRISSADGMEAGRAAALAALTRIVCAKTTNEEIPQVQLAQYLAMVQQALVNKERLVLCCLFYYGHSLYRLGLPSIEALLPHYLFALDLILIESSKLKLHPSFDSIDMRRCCLHSLSTIIPWPTTFGADTIPQLAEYASLKSSSTHFIHLRLRIYKSLIFSLRNESDSFNLQLTLAMCTILCEESSSFDLSMSNEEREILLSNGTTKGGLNSANGFTPEKAECSSLVRGVISAICDRLCRSEWQGDFSLCLSAIDTLNAISTIHPHILFTNGDLSTGMLIVSSLCRFIETQLNKPPPFHSRDLHSSVVAAYQSLVVWFSSSPLLAECESTLQIVADTIQFGIKGTKKEDESLDKKSASKRVEDAAQMLMNSLFTIMGRRSSSAIVDERRLLYLFGPSAIDTTKFQHFFINNDSLLSIHEASHIPTLAKGGACVIYVRRSPMHMACVGFARLKMKHDDNGNDKDGTLKSSSPASSSVVSSSSPLPQSPSPSTSTNPPSTPSSTSLAEKYSMAKAYQLPPDFHKISCKLDARFRKVESTRESEEMLLELQKSANMENRDWSDGMKKKTKEDRIPKPKPAVKTCDSIRVFLYDMGLIDEKYYGDQLIPLDSTQSIDFYRDLHDMVDSTPSCILSTTHIFYVRNGQRSALDILENGMNLQSLSSEFLLLLSSLGEGIEVDRHDGWTGHWTTSFDIDTKPQEEKEAVDHYILDGMTHSLWYRSGGCEMAFVLPSQRSIRYHKQEMPVSRSSRSGKSTVAYSQSEVMSPTRLDYKESDDVFVQSPSVRGVQPYQGGGSSMGNSSVPLRRSQSEQRILVIWVERLEDVPHFPLEDLLPICDDGSDRHSLSIQPSPSSSTSIPSSSSSHHHPSPSGYNSGHSPGARSQGSTTTVPYHQPFIAIFLHEVESGLIEVRTRSSPMRYGGVGPLMDGVVVSLSSLPSLIHLTLLNLSRRSVVEVENYQFCHVKRRSSMAQFTTKYKLQSNYEEFLTRLIS